jgi:cell division protein FtsB
MLRVGMIVFGLLTLGMVVLTFVSDRGLLEVRRQAARYDALEQEIETLEAENGALEDEIQALRSDPDEIERRAREDLKLVRPGEIILVLPSEEAEE